MYESISMWLHFPFNKIPAAVITLQLQLQLQLQLAQLLVDVRLVGKLRKSDLSRTGYDVPKLLNNQITALVGAAPLTSRTGGTM